ncbi:MAG TPA: MBL fold metallo-hydrolase [Actinoplanes sp.]|nr:MBL fold metallo-hydrolase [Actinoplanes sp.]
MHITKYSHSCLRITGDGVLVVDPGVFSERSALDDADAVLITHEHPDHVDVAALAAACAGNPDLVVHAHPDVLAKLGVPARPIEPGQTISVAGLDVTAYGGQHAIIHPDIPRVANLGYLIADGAGTLYHPGDSFVVPGDAAVDTLFVPVAAPWLKLSEAIDFVRAVRPKRAFALHDALLTEDGAKITDTHLTNLSGCDYARLTAGSSTD